MSNTLTGVKRILGHYGDASSGPLFIVMGGIHGNEQAGIHALESVFKQLEANQPAFQGEFYGVAGNLKAIESGQRFIDHDLNRVWFKEKIDSIRKTPRALIDKSEDIEQKELLILFDRLKKQNEGRQLVMLDLHTTSAKTGTFTIATVQPESRNLSMVLRVPVITNLDTVIKSTTLNYFKENAFTAFAFEAGHHYDPECIVRMEAAIWLSLGYLNCLRAEDIPSLNKHIRILDECGKDYPKMVRFLYRHHVEDKDHFIMKPGYKNFQKVDEKEHLANDVEGPIFSPYKGMILMPLYQKKGEDGFFIIEALDI